MKRTDFIVALLGGIVGFGGPVIVPFMGLQTATGSEMYLATGALIGAVVTFIGITTMNKLVGTIMILAGIAGIISTSLLYSLFSLF